jgi:hypothetical protein
VKNFILFFVAIFLSLGLIKPANSTSLSPIDSLTAWVEEVREIPVYLDGVLIHYIIVKTWVWVDDTPPDHEK